MMFKHSLIGLATVAAMMTVGFDPAFAQRCKYKTDGAGNCLSPSFYACQRNWTACSKKCEAGKAAKDGKAVLACKDACEIKYAPRCGD